MNNHLKILTITKVMPTDEFEIREYVLLHNVDKDFFNVICCHIHAQPLSLTHLQQNQALTKDILLGLPPEERKDWFPFIPQAIQAHDCEFDQFFEDF